MQDTHARTKVLFLITKSNWGGAQRYVYDLATHLDTKLFEPVVALGGDGVLKAQLIHAGVRVISINSLERDISLKKEVAFIQELWRILRTEKPDVLHVNSSKAGAVGTLVGQLARVPRVFFTAHGWAFNEDRPLWQRFIIKSIHYLTVLLSDRTIAVSNAIVTQMNWPLAERKMKVVFPGRTIGVMYDRPEARRHLLEAEPKLTPFENDIFILTIAELHPIKRLHVLVSAMSQLTKIHPKIRSIIIGAGTQRPALTSQIQSLGLQNNVFLLGSITEAARLLHAGDIFVLPSKSESYGYVLHEAGLAELPVVATHVGGIPDIVTSGTSGTLVEPDSATTLAQAINTYLEQPELRANHATALKTAMSSRSVDKMVAATTALYLLPLK